MKTFMHADAHAEKDCKCIAEATDEFGVRWPAIPWKCTGCKHVFVSHAQTVAVVDDGFLKRAREIVARGKRRLAAGLNENGDTLQECDIAATRVTIDLAEQSLAHPARFLCSTCLLDTVAKAHGDVIQKVIQLDVDEGGSRLILDLLRALQVTSPDGAAEKRA